MKKNNLIDLESKMAELKKKVNINSSFSNEKDFELFVEKNKDLLIELKKIKNEINRLKFEIMTVEEKKKMNMYLKELKKKYK